MTEEGPPSWLRGLAVTQTTSTVYAALGATCGAILYLIAPYFQGNPWGWFFAGMAIPTGPLYLAFTSDWIFERRLRRLKRWLDDDLMPSRMYDESLERAIAWRDERLYGKSSNSSRSTPRKRAVRPVTKAPQEFDQISGSESVESPSSDPK